MAAKHKNITISMPIRLADEIDAMRHEDDYGVSEIYLYLIREGLRVERDRRQAKTTGKKEK